MEFKIGKKKTKDYTVIIGCGRLGASLAGTLSDEDRNVLIIDDRKESFRKLTSSFGGLTILGDGTDIEVLKDAKVQEASAVIIVTDNDNTNILAAQLVKKWFHCEKVIMRLYDSHREFICQDMGIHVVCPALLTMFEVGKILHEEKGMDTK